MNILIFIKAPVPGQVKTRLFPLLTPEQAAALYRQLAHQTMDQARQVPHARVIVAYAVHPAFPDLSWVAGSGEWIPQTGNDLGEKLIAAVYAMDAKHPGPIVIIGSDLPDLTADLLTGAEEALRTHDVVLGPATDGGYYLIGFQKPQPALFENIPWSGPDVLKTTLTRVKEQSLSCELLPEKSDLDTPEDYQRLKGQLHAHHHV